jgi:hypothetical protein
MVRQQLSPDAEPFPETSAEHLCTFNQAAAVKPTRDSLLVETSENFRPYHPVLYQARCLRVKRKMLSGPRDGR